MNDAIRGDLRAALRSCEEVGRLDTDRIIAALEPAIRAYGRECEVRRLRSAAAWLELDPEFGGAPMTTRNGVTLPNHTLAWIATTWAITSIEDYATELESRKQRVNYPQTLCNSTNFDGDRCTLGAGHLNAHASNAGNRWVP